MMKTIAHLIAVALIAPVAWSQVSWWTPVGPQPGDDITIYYDAVAGTLPDGSTNVILHWGVNENGQGNWNAPPSEIWPPGTILVGIAAQSPMNDDGGGMFSITISTTVDIYSLHYVTTDGSNWDNNGSQNWDIWLDTPPPVVEHNVIFRFDPRSAFSQFHNPVFSVNLAGTFNAWSLTATPLTDVDPYGNFLSEIPLSAGDLEYKFVVNGSDWQIDPDNPRNAPGGYNNSLLTVVADSFPQVYDVTPYENSVFNVGTSVNISLKVRPGDYGSGLFGIPAAEVDGVGWPATWNPVTSQLNLDPLPSQAGIREIVISAQDSSGRWGNRSLAYGFRDTGYLAVDPRDDQVYANALPGLDLVSFTARERAGGDSIEFIVRLDTVGIEPDRSLILLTISQSTAAYSEILGLDAEFRVPDLQSGGVAMLLIDPASSYFDSAVHNRIILNGDLGQPGPILDTGFGEDPNGMEIRAVAATSDLESYLGSYQASWHYTCATLRPASAAAGYCREVTAADGGSDAVDESDVYDVLFMMADDVQQKMFMNFGLTRRVTMDAAGRGVEEIQPDEIGPNIRHVGPVCQVLTRGAPTTDSTRTIVGNATAVAAITEVFLEHNGVPTLVILSADTFAQAVVLTEGINTFTAWAVDVNGDTGRSAAMNYELIIAHAPVVDIIAGVQGAQGILDASGTTDPQGDPMSFLWSPDPENPAAVILNSSTTATADFNVPAVPGEYYFDLEVSDAGANISHGRTFIRVLDSGVGDPFVFDQSAEWVRNAIVYEIFVRSYSATGDLDGITADIDRIAELGVNTIWLMPIFDGPTDHGYATEDYYSVEQDYGTTEDLHELVAACHANGIRLVLDMVINHSGIGHPFMQDAIAHGHYSHYWDWYDRDGSGNYTYYYDWTSLPNINHANSECAQYYIDMCKWWVSEFDIDGFRCDVAWGPHDRTPAFWVEWRRQLKTIKPELFLLAEAGANDFSILTDRFDLAYDWSLLFDGSAGFTNMFPGAPSFSQLTNLITNYGTPWPDYKDPFRFMENHDESRYISIKTAQQTKLVSSLLLSIPGIPMLYAGQEIGTMSQRGLIPWGTDPDNMNPHYRDLVVSRRVLPAMSTGEWTQLSNDQSSTCYSYARTLDGEFPVVFLGNFGSTSQLVTVNLDTGLLDIHPDSTYVVTDIIGGTNFTEQGADLTNIFTSLSSYQSRVWVIGDSVFTPDLTLPPVEDLTIQFIEQSGDDLHIQLNWSPISRATSYSIYQLSQPDGGSETWIGSTALPQIDILVFDPAGVSSRQFFHVIAEN